MTRRKQAHPSERRGPLSGSAIALEQRTIPASDATPAMLLSDPKLAVQLSARELEDIQKKAAKARSKS